jgi:hypothetical protein
MLFERLRDGGLLMVKATVKETAPKANRSCDDDGASHKDAHGSTPFVPCLGNSRGLLSGEL